MSPLKKRFGHYLKPMREKDRACLCKRRFDSKEECEASIRAGGKPYGEVELRAYKCQFCTGWHKTKHKSAHKEGETMKTDAFENQTFRDLCIQTDICEKIEETTGIVCDAVDLHMIIQLLQENRIIPPI